jgi:hypothetical protein
MGLAVVLIRTPGGQLMAFSIMCGFLQPYK